MPNSIPFLRDVRDTSNFNWNKVRTGGQYDYFAVQPPTGARRGQSATVLSPQVRRAKSRDLRRRKIRELGWNGYELPISKFNEGVHSSNRIPFEKI